MRIIRFYIVYIDIYNIIYYTNIEGPKHLQSFKAADHSIGHNIELEAVK